MLVLNEVQTPVEEVETVQPQVVGYWEDQCLGMGTLYLTIRKVVWISDANRMGFVLTYPAITVHATSTSNENFPDPCLFLVIDVKKTDVEYTPHQAAEEADEEEEEDLTATIRFVPSDPSAIPHLYETMNECQIQNPELDEDNMNESDIDEDEEELLNHQPVGEYQDETDEGERQWYTAENPPEEVHLSAQGRANLRRMLGGHDPSGAQHATQNGRENSSEMDES